MDCIDPLWFLLFSLPFMDCIGFLKLLLILCMDFHHVFARKKGFQHRPRHKPKAKHRPKPKPNLVENTKAYGIMELIPSGFIIFLFTGFL